MYYDIGETSIHPFSLFSEELCKKRIVLIIHLYYAFTKPFISLCENIDNYSILVFANYNC